MPKWDGTQEPVGEILALKRQNCRDLAQEMLEKVYRYVLPIMKKRRYRVHKLCEFLPKTQNLLGLNVNHGQRISLRLRYHHNPQEFLPFESVLGTMLHELCHNTYGPHNQQFFSLLDELTTEMEDMIAKGFTGDPFMGFGQMVGGTPLSRNFVGNNPANSRILRNPQPGTAGTPAATPYGANRKLGKGKKLGGLGTRVSPLDRDSKRALALQAAERRREAEMACRSVKRVSDLSQEDRGEVIDLTDEPEGPSSREESPQIGTARVAITKQETKPNTRITHRNDSKTASSRPELRSKESKKNNKVEPPNNSPRENGSRKNEANPSKVHIDPEVIYIDD